jgi:hypothetical protein
MGVKNMPDNSVNCGNCGYVFPGDDLDKESGNRKPCPKCGDFRRNINLFMEEKIVLKDEVSGVHEAHMSATSWTIFALFLTIILTLISYVVFSTTIMLWYKLLILLGIIFIPFIFAYRYRIIWYKIIIFLRYLENNTYGKHKF